MSQLHIPQFEHWKFVRVHKTKAYNPQSVNM